MCNKVSKIFKENTEKGSLGWTLERPAMNREIEGFASHCSIDVGEKIDLFVNTKAANFTLDIYRMGWYNGFGAREIRSTIVLSGKEQESPLPDSETGLVECNWSVGYALQTTKEWMTGVYIVKLEESEAQKQSYIIFVLRDDSASPDILFQLPMTTYQAYNYWGGKNLYESGSGCNTKWGTKSGKPATKVSFNRPYAASNNPKAAFGMGAGDFFTNTRPVTTHNYPISSAGWDYNMVRWLEKNGYDIAYSTSLDTHSRREQLQKPKVFLAHGHDEYWSHEMRANVTLARDQGTHLAFISSNTMFWQIRFEDSIADSKPNRIIACYKSTELDPVKGKKSTVNFRDIPDQGSEASLIGVNYILDPVVGDITITNAEHWVFENSGLKNEDKLKGLLGYEIDALAENSPVNISVLASSISQNRDKSNYPGVIKYMLIKVFKISAQPLEKKLKIPGKLSLTLVALILLLGFLFLWQVFANLGIMVLLIAGVLVLSVFLIWFIKIVNSGKVTSHMTIYEAKSKAFVFATGSMQWAWGLDDYNSPGLRKSFHNNAVEITTHNLLRKFGAVAHSTED